MVKLLGTITFVGILFSFIPQAVSAPLPLIFQFFIGNTIGSTAIIAIVLNLIFVVGLKSPGK